MPVLLPSPVFRWFVPAQNGTGLVPAAGYKAKFYSAGTTDAKAIYDVDGTIYPSPSNVATLNSEGYAGIKLGNGSYKLVVTTSVDVEVYSQDNISGGGTFGSGFIDTVIGDAGDGLAEADTDANRFVWCAGYYEIGDGGHGFFWNEASTDPDDTGYVIASTFDPTKRWFRTPDESGDVRAASFGYIGTRSGNLTTQLLAASAYAHSNSKRLLIGPGTAAIIGIDANPLYLYAPEIHFEWGSMLTGTGDFATLNLVALVTGTPEQHFTGFQAKFRVTQACENPEWFGAQVNDPNNTTAFTAWLASEASSFTLPPGAWNMANSGTFLFPTVPLTLLGSITGTVGTTIPTGVYFPDTSRFRLHQILFPNGATITEWDEGTGIDIVGDTVVAGAISTAAGSAAGISSDGNVSANSDVAAGLSAAGGRLTARAGASSNRFVASGLYYSVRNSVSTSGTGATNLLSTVISAYTLVEGDRLRICLAGTSSSPSSQAKTITVKLGSTTIATLSLTFQTEDWRMVIEAWWTGSGCYASSVLHAATLSICDNTSTGASIPQSADQTLQVIGTASVAGTITQDTLSIEYYPGYT